MTVMVMKKIYFLIPLILFIIDRIIKYIVPSINSGDDLLRFAIYKNSDGPFGLALQSEALNAFGAILVIIFLALFIKEYKKKYIITALGFCFIFFGGLSNLFDRLFLGYVIDYIQITERSFFNLADVMLIIGVTFVIISSFKSKDAKYE